MKYELNLLLKNVEHYKGWKCHSTKPWPV